ncbi:MAG TPA: VWA domain-containing protein [Blastocatellia bacterium]|nr:VWA domain-containing protein [Blastocatellia bacterium]
MKALIDRTARRQASKGLRSPGDQFPGAHRVLLRMALVVLAAAGAMINAPRQIAQQQPCSTDLPKGCFTPVKRDIGFILDRSTSIAQKGETYNVEIQGVLRALRDPTAIPRDGSVAVAVITFAEDATVVAPLTEINSTAVAESVAAKVEALLCADTTSQTGKCPFGGTSYTAAIITADAHLNQNRREGARRVLLMSSDGEPDDPDLGVGAANNARVAALLSGITSELDVILLGLESAAQIAANKAKVDQIVFPQPATNLPGATLLLQGGECNRPGAIPNSADCDRQANDFSDLARSIIRSDVAPLSMVVTTEADTAPQTGAAPSGPLSLRQAIELANCNGGKATITFADGVKGKTLRPLVPLPALTASDITINGCDGENCDPWLTINGAATDSEKGEAHPNGLLIRSGRNVVRGLRIINFTGAGIAIDRICPFDNVGHNRIERNVLESNTRAGVLAADTLSEGKESFNIRNTISRNTISNSAAPIDLNGDGPTANDDGDPDLGPNTLLNFPDSINVVSAAGAVNITGQVNGPTKAGATVEVFAVTNFTIVSGKLVIQGASFLAQTTTAENGSFSLTGVGTSATGIYTATVTDRAGNTSELMSETGNVKPGRPDATLTAAVDFGDVPVNTTPPGKTVEVTNTGNAPLIVTLCSIVKCNSADRDDTARFTITGCPTGPINPGEHVTITITVSANACGVLHACLNLTTNIPRQPILQVPLTANVGGPAQAKLTLQGGAAALDFAAVTPRGKPRKAKAKNARTFTIQNQGCATLNLTFASIVRTGNASRIVNKDDSAFFSVSLLSATGTETPISIGPNGTASVGGLQTVTFRVRIRPVIPVVIDCPGNPSGLSANEVLPDEVLSQLNITSNGGALTVNLVGHVSTGVQLIDPCSPNQPPLVTLTRSGDQFTVQFSAFDSNLSINHATYRFLNRAGATIDQVFDIDLTQSIRDRNLVRGQSVTVSQSFTGGVSALQIDSVQVTVFDGETSESATSGTVTSSSTSSSTISIRSDGPGRQATLVLPVVKFKRGRRE